MDVVHAKVVEDYTKIKETLFVEAWQVWKRKKLLNLHELSTFMSHCEDVDMN